MQKVQSVKPIFSKSDPTIFWSYGLYYLPYILYLYMVLRNEGKYNSTVYAIKHKYTIKQARQELCQDYLNLKKLDFNISKALHFNYGHLCSFEETNARQKILFLIFPGLF